MDALGLIENRSYLSSIVAADTALKAANVTLIDMEIIRGGYVTVKLIGDVGAVKAAVEAAKDAAESFGALISAHVIPRMHEETAKLIEKQKGRPAASPEGAKPTAKQEKEENGEQAKTEAVQEESPSPAATERNEENGQEKLTREQLEKLTVVKLRQLVRERKAMESATQINTAKKAELIHSLLEKMEKKE